MILKKEQLKIEEGNLKNGKGNCKREVLVDPKYLKGQAKLFAKISIPVGNSIGMHDHVEDFEVYYILKGKGQVLDNYEIIEVNVGDVIYTADGNKHFIENIGDEDLEFIAVVINE
ncbi:MAG: cupin domain-containing protein [Terrisporobacter sp.]|uniref:cupin domain-containing protein n=1 Tax=Terrisporobacter sp. TaxID=1965305 RepID=UPI002FC76AD0